MSPDLDAHLRDVPLPDGLVARVQASLGPTDEEVDAALRQVMIPLGLVQDLRRIPDDALVDQRLSDVAAPFEMVRQMRRQRWTSRVRRAMVRAAELAVALSLFLAISGALLGAVVVMIASIYPDAQPSETPAFVIAANLPLDLESSQADSDDNRFVSTMTVPVSLDARPPPAFVTRGIEVDPPDLSPAATSGPVDQWLSSLRRGVHPLDNVVLLRYGIFGSPQFGEEVTPPLESPVALRSAGIELPRVRGYDRLFVVRHGVFPPVSPAAHRELAEFELPLTKQTDSYEHVRRLLAENPLPSPASIRTEDFLAAMAYDFPPAAPGELAIRTAAGPSIFGPPGVGLLQVAAIAGELPRTETDGGHLVLALDMSQTMARGRRLDLVRQSIDRLVARMGPRDRLSLVVFDEKVRYVVERAASRDAEQLRRLLADLRPAGATDLAEGIQQGAVLAMTEQAPQSRPSHLVLVTDSQVAMPEVTQSLVGAVLWIAEEEGVRMDVLDVGDHVDEDEVLAQWSALMHGAVLRPTTAAAAALKLTECLYGRSPVVGNEARLTLRLDPQAVARYRLIGSEGNSLSSLLPASREVDLAPGEAASALLEIWFQASEADTVGTLELSWLDPASGRIERRGQRISRLQFAPTWEQAPLSLQQAAIAAETAEVLRGSRTALRELGLVPQGSGDLAAVTEAAQRVHPRLAEQREFRAWVRMVGELSNMRP